MRRSLALIVIVATLAGAGVARDALPAHAAPSARPDFNCDGYADLAVGAPHATVNGVADAGAVYVYFGSDAGLKPTPTVLGIGLMNAAGTPVAGDHFGAATAAGSFDNSDDCDDLAVGALGRDVNNQTDAGAVFIFFGDISDPSGFKNTKTRSLARGVSGVPGTAAPNARWGAALAAGDANGDVTDELAIGAPGDTQNLVASGSVTVLNGPCINGSYTGALFTAGVNSVPGPAVAGDGFGAALAFGNFTDEGLADFSQELAIGVPGFDAAGAPDAGAVVVLPAAAGTGLTGVGSSRITQDSPGVYDRNEAKDGFGSALAAGYFIGGDSAMDLAIGVPGEGVGSVMAAGAVSVIGGGPAGLAQAGSAPPLLLVESAKSVPATAKLRDMFGWSVSAARLDGVATVNDLVIGVPFKDVGTTAAGVNAGAIVVVPNNGGSLRPTSGRMYVQGRGGVPGMSEKNDRFGWRVAAGDFTDSGADQVVVGSPYEDVGSKIDAGGVIVIGSSGGALAPATAGAEQLADASGVPGAQLSGDQFGAV